MGGGLIPPPGRGETSHHPLSGTQPPPTFTMTEHGLLERALSEPIGLAVPTSNAEALRRRLTVARSKDPQFQSLTITVSPIEKTEIWIVRKEYY